MSREDKKTLKKYFGFLDFDVWGDRADQQVLKGSRVKGISKGVFSKRMENFLLNSFSEQSRNIAMDFEEGIDKNLRKKILMCSFSTSCYNDLMWAHYSGSHKGYCIEYEFPFGGFYDEGNILPVVYRMKPVDVTNLVRNDVFKRTALSSAAMGSAIVKSLSWKYENEW